MKPVRTLAHALLASVFISGAIRTLRDPEHAARQATPLSERIAPRLEQSAPWVPTSPVALARTNAGVQLAGGLLLTTGKAPRLAAVALAGSLLPTTAMGHPFWQADNPTDRANERTHFLKNLGLLGGLLLAAVDTQGRPGLRWRASHATERAAGRLGRGAGRATRTARREAKIAARAASAGRRLGRR